MALCKLFRGARARLAALGAASPSREYVRSTCLCLVDHHPLLVQVRASRGRATRLWRDELPLPAIPENFC
jgi:hypothetical protein